MLDFESKIHEIPEIVRCRDCENARVQPWNPITRTGLWCVEHDIPIDVDGFCAWGERRDE